MSDRYWIDHCIGIARDAGNIDSARDATNEIERLQAQRDAAVKAITHHNNACQNLCGTGHFEASACGYRRHFEITGRRCPECPTNYKIEWPQDAAIDAAKEEKK